MLLGNSFPFNNNVTEETAGSSKEIRADEERT